MKTLRKEKMKKGGRTIFVQIGSKMYYLVAQYQMETGIDLSKFLDNNIVMLIDPKNF